MLYINITDLLKTVRIITGVFQLFCFNNCWCQLTMFWVTCILSNTHPISKNNIGDNSRSIGGEVHSDGDFLLLERNRYSRRGFLYKGFPLSSVVSNYSVLLGCSCSLLFGHLAVSFIHTVYTSFSAL